MQVLEAGSGQDWLVEVWAVRCHRLSAALEGSRCRAFGLQPEPH